MAGSARTCAGAVVAALMLCAAGPAGAQTACAPGGYGTGGESRTGKPDDPLFDAQWGLRQIRAQALPRRARGAGARVAIVDTGVDLGHPDLDGRLEPGIDLWESRPGAAPDCPGAQDEDFHGTMVAGVVGAGRDNGIGIAGVAPRARLIPVRVRPTVGSTDFSRVGDGIRWAADTGADVISLTGGTIFPVKPSPVIAEDIDAAAAYAWERGVLIVATAGNNSLPWCQYPAALDNVVCAAANAPDGTPAGYSQLPLQLGSGIAVRAPGGRRAGSCDSPDDVWSTSLPGAAAVDGCGERGYATDSGTTYASAHTSGVAAILAGRGLDNVEILECLKTTSSNRGAYDPLTGYGTVDARAALSCVR